MSRSVLTMLALFLTAPAWAFPSTGILDNFNRANENPLSNAGSLGAPITAGSLEKFKLVSNALQDDSLADGGGSSQVYWDAASFGPGSEVYFDLSTLWQASGSDGWCICHIASPGANLDGYVFYFSWSTGTTWDISIQRSDNGAWTELESGSTTLASGDSVGLECTASGILTMYRKTGGTWAALSPTASDTTYTSGFVGFSKGFHDTTSIVDNFGGGTIVAAAARMRLLLGVGQ
jgi:hypothetical protein